MKIKTYLFAILAFSAIFIAASGSAQGQDSTALKMSLDSLEKAIASDPAVLAASADAGGDTVAKRPNFFKRFINYFANANKPTDKKFNVSFIGGPHYATGIGFGIGLVASGLYSSHRGDPLTPISNISLTADATTKGFVLVGFKGNHFTREAKWKIDYSLFFYRFPCAFWGLGYENGNVDANKSGYNRMQMYFKGDFMHRFAKNFYAGPIMGYDIYISNKYKFATPELQDKLLGDRSPRTHSIHYGIAASYDSRDFIPNPYKGIYAAVRQRNFINFDDKPYYNTIVQFNFYQRLWKDCIMAGELYSQFNYGTTPWTMMAMIGGSSRMRGYYEGRYRDNNMVTATIELRQRIWRRIGATLWGGAGNTWGEIDAFQWRHTLPNWGIGFRWEFKKRVNVRLDYGFGKNGQQAFIFGINEAF